MTRLALVALLSIAGCSKSEPAPAASAPSAPATTQAAPASTTPKPPRGGKDPAAARQLIAAGAIVIDVRTTEEFDEDHLARATHIPVQQLARRITEVDALVGGDKSRPVVLYCASGSRSGTAKAQLEAAGYTQVVNGGGLDDLRQQAHPTIRDVRWFPRCLRRSNSTR